MNIIIMETIVDNLDQFVINEDYAMKIFWSVRWADGVYCPKCKSFEHIVKRGVRGKANRYSCTSCGNNFNDFSNTPFAYAKISFGKILYILLHIESKSMKRLAKELKLHRTTDQRYHKRIRDYLLENNVDPTFNGEIEMDELYVIAGEKGLKKTRKPREHREKED
jgi:transposase-like protein